MMQNCGTATCAYLDAATTVVGYVGGAIGAGAAYLANGVPWLWPVVAGLAGAIMASLIGLIVDRLPKMRGWNGPPDHSITLSSPASHCDHCGEKLSLSALIPVIGWLGAKGRAECCGAPVPWIYPAVEGASCLVSLIIIAVLGPTWAGLATLILFWALLLASWMDIAEHEIPDFITMPLLFLGLLASPIDPDPMSRIVGAIIGGGLIWSAFWLTKAASDEDTMSYGDVALTAALGAWCGSCGVVWALFGAVAVYIGYAAPLRWKGVVWAPMGPALAVGFAISSMVISRF